MEDDKIIRVFLGEDQYTVDCDDEETSARTYGELRRKLVDEDGVTEATHYMLTDADGEELMDDDPIDFAIKDVFLKPRGEEEDDEEYTGIMSVFIFDRDCDTDKVPIETDAEATIEHVLQLYCTQGRRHLHVDQDNQPLCELFREEDDERLDLSLKVSESGLSNESNLVYKAPAYSIMLKEKDVNGKPGQETEVQVTDDMTVDAVKEAYSRVADEGLVEGDALVFGQQDLDDEKQIYKYQLKQGSQLKVEREDFTTMHFTYSCADCGSDVKLKKDDLVRCRVCGYRVVFKQRTKVQSQYLCR